MKTTEETIKVIMTGLCSREDIGSRSGERRRGSKMCGAILLFQAE